MESTWTSLLLDAAGSPVSTGPGIGGFVSWIVAAVVVLLLGGLAWWTARPERRATRAELRRTRIERRSR